MKRWKFVVLLFLLNMSFCVWAEEHTMYWWRPGDSTENFGDELSRVVVEKIIQRPLHWRSLQSKEKLLLAEGSILLHARDGDVIWGSGIRENINFVTKKFKFLDVRAVRGPFTRRFLLNMGISCPEIYGDPAILLPTLFPELKKADHPIYDYIIIPNRGEIEGFLPYKNVVLPTLPWRDVVQKILQSKLVISSSLHGIILAEAFGVPARLLKMTWIEGLIKYQDYYASTGRLDFSYATSVQSALQMGGEKPGFIDHRPLLNSFPWDYFK